MSLDAIPIHVINPASETSGLTGNAPPLLRELSEGVKRLLASGQTSAIDLSALPLTPADLPFELRRRLVERCVMGGVVRPGEGETAAVLLGNGRR